MSDSQKIKEKPFVSVVICTQNRKEYLENYSLPSVLEQTYPHYEVVVVNDNSKDDTEKFLHNYKDAADRLKIVDNKLVKGISYARQLGVNYAGGEIIAFTDDDCIVDTSWLKDLVSAFEEDKTLMAVGGLTYDGNTSNPNLPSNGIFGFNMSFRKRVFERFSFDPNLFFHQTCYHEETDLVNRLKDHDYKTAQIKKAVVRHFPAPAEYRKIRKIAIHMNWIYMQAKKTPLPMYYYRFFKRSRQMYAIIKELYKKGVLSFWDTLKDMAWANYVLLFELPFKAKTAHWREEREFRNGKK